MSSPIERIGERYTRRELGFLALRTVREVGAFAVLQRLGQAPNLLPPILDFLGRGIVGDQLSDTDLERFPLEDMGVFVPTEDLFTTEPEKSFYLGPKRETGYRVSEFLRAGDFDRAYVANLLKALTKKNGDSPKVKSLAIFNSLGYISGPKGGGTCLMIDESGYYLTAAHIVDEVEKYIKKPKENYIFVYEPRSGKTNTVKGVIFDPGLDVAMVYAPTGKSRKPVNNIQLLPDEPLISGLPLWQFGFNIRYRDGNHMYVVLLRGNIDKHVQDPDSFDLFVKVRGMIPFGGSSGGPVMDAQGRVVGIESGAYHIEAIVAGDYSNYPDPRRSDYLGSGIAPIQGIFGLLNKPIHSFKNS